MKKVINLLVVLLLIYLSYLGLSSQLQQPTSSRWLSDKSPNEFLSWPLAILVVLASLVAVIVLPTAKRKALAKALGKAASLIQRSSSPPPGTNQNTSQVGLIGTVVLVISWFIFLLGTKYLASQLWNGMWDQGTFFALWFWIGGLAIALLWRYLAKKEPAIKWLAVIWLFVGIGQPTYYQVVEAKKHWSQARAAQKAQDLEASQNRDKMMESVGVGYKPIIAVSDRYTSIYVSCPDCTFQVQSDGPVITICPDGTVMEDEVRGGKVISKVNGKEVAFVDFDQLRIKSGGEWRFKAVQPGSRVHVHISWGPRSPR